MFKKGNPPPKHKVKCRCFRCSRIPWNKNTKGICKPWNKGKKGLQVAWNKGTKGLMAEPWNKGKKFQQVSGKNSHWWKGGRKKDSYGYILVYKPEHPFCNKARYVPEHRLVVEKKIGRYLLAIEEVHHLNKIKGDNRPENLMAFINDGAHKRFECNQNNVKPKEIIFNGRIH